MQRRLCADAQRDTVVRDLSPSPNLPDEIWARLKTWTKAQAASSAQPGLDECEAYVRGLCRELTGNPDVLRPDVAAFYASEARDMIVKFQATVIAEGGVA